MILEKKAVLDRLENDVELYDEICELFKSEGPDLFRKLDCAVQAQDLVLATRLAHSLKSTAANIGAMEMSSCARSAELAGRCGDWHELREALPHLEKMLGDVLAELS